MRMISASASAVVTVVCRVEDYFNDLPH